MIKKPPSPPPVSDAIDNHTHVNMCGVTNATELAELVDRAAAVGVKQLVTVGTDVETSLFATQAATWHSAVYAAVAIHPTDADQLDESAKQQLTRLAALPRTVAIGETGLDYYWLAKPGDCASKASQIAAFKWHIQLAKDTGKVLMIHNREADADVYRILEEVGAPKTVVLHCFSSDITAAKICIERGYYISLAGNSSFKNAPILQEAVKIIPDELILTETDAPFLTPHPFRGQPNESYCLPYTLAALAELRGTTAEKLGQIAANNARRVYNLENIV